MKKPGKFSKFCYSIMYFFLKAFYPKISVVGAENLSNDGCVVVGNHTQMNGPICGEIYFPGKHTIWCAYQMMYFREVPAYAFKDFWSNKPKFVRWFYKLLSYFIAPFSVCVFKNAHTIPVYHDTRIMTTFRSTVTALSEDNKVIIFPECYEPYNNIINNFQKNFVDVARLYYKKTGKKLTFNPMYIAPKLKTIYIGKAIEFNPDTPIDEERERICNYLMQQITDIAINLPIHTVVPYANVSKSEYKKNIPLTEAKK